ncbi:hypothetical protein [Vibrio campbellii]|uniref:hypothetical protein n=1 Tax=Vibrio campbellii TaxID=680 RepID=UPI00210C942A|nr:hypothetical protein [Vibrio campbellii]UTZ44552.1 hypothetical protein HB764_25155 [Vibrio campbellii]
MTQQTQTNSMSLSDLHTRKKQADERVQKALEVRATYRAPIEQYDEHGFQLHRTVCVVKRDKSTSRLLQYLGEQKEANIKLLERGSEYFDAESQIFREAVVIENVRTVNISTTTSASVKTVTGEKLASLIRKQINRYALLVEKTEDPEEKERLENLVLDGHIQVENFMKQPDKKYKRRSIPTKEVIARVRYKQGTQGLSDLEKHCVTAAGLIIIRGRHCEDSDIVVNDETTVEQRSIYDDVMPIETILDIRANIYDADELDLVREANKKRRTDNVGKSKSRSQFDGLIV